MTRAHTGGCHCGAVRFEARLDLADGTSRCNCSACGKGRFWKAIVRHGDFRLVQGEEALSTYRFGSRTIEHRFCRTCGVKPFGRGELEVLGGVFYAINVACLDDVTREELAAVPVAYEDGRHDAWQQRPAVTSYL